LYWTNPSSGAIGRANIDGTRPDIFFIVGARDPVGVAVGGGHIYWTNAGTSTIGRANLDGTGVDENFIVLPPNSQLQGIAAWAPSAVAYDGNGADGGSPPTDGASPYSSGATVTVLGAGTLTRTGYTFAGWNTQADGGGTSYQPGDTFS